MDYSNNLSNDSQTYTEIILGLPGDTKHKHFESLRFGVRHHTNSLRMYQAMLLAGTEMDTKECREKYGLITRFRTIPGCVGIYRFFGEDHPVVEIEEIIVGSKDMPFEDYIECRIMNLVIETFYNNSLFEEIFGVIRAVGGDVFDCLLYVKDHSELYSPRIAEIIDEFVHQTSADVFDTREEAERFVLTPDVIGRYVGGDLGINELLVHKALLFRELPQISELLVTAAKACLRDHDLLTRRVEHYIDELLRFIVQAKRDILETDHVSAMSSRTTLARSAPRSGWLIRARCRSARPGAMCFSTTTSRSGTSPRKRRCIHQRPADLAASPRAGARMTRPRLPLLAHCWIS